MAANSTSARTDEAVQAHLDRLLKTRDYPKTICPSEVARALSKSELDTTEANDWRDLMPRIRELVWMRRDAGEVEILQKGEVIGDSIGLDDIKGPIRVRLRHESSNDG